MIEHHNTEAPGVENLKQRCEAARTSFLNGVAEALVFEEVLRARAAGEEPSEERVQERARQMSERASEVQP